MSKKKPDRKSGAKGGPKRRAIRKRPIKNEHSEVFQQEPEVGLEEGDGGRPGKPRRQS